MFSLLWSEHCAYKHSRKLLRRLPTEGERVVMGPGENAGAVDVGNGHAVAFKVESHNHPSAVEPFQGAATGVGGILRDVFAIGARPIAVLDSLRFGELSSERSRYLFEGAVAGIGHYGNSIGVPTVGGEVYFEPSYEHNCLVNAMCVGLARTEEMIRSAAAGPGNLLVIMGASTGRDGIGGASVLASAELEAGDDSKRPSVQIGDPFEESKLLECCLELLERGLLVSLQDLGAAGLDLVGRRDGLEGRRRDRHRRRAGAAPRAGPRAVRGDDLRVAGADAGGGRARAARRGGGDLRALADRGRRDRRDHRGGSPARPRRRRRGRERAGRAPWSTNARSTTCEPEEPRAGWIGTGSLASRPSARALSRPERPVGGPLRPARLARTSPRSAGRSSSTTRWCGSRTVRRPEAADAAVLQLPESGPGDRRGDRRQRAAGRLRPIRRGGRGGAGVRPEPRLRRRRAARPHQLPQLRQPGEAQRRLAARSRGARPGRRLRRARGARSSAATSPSTTRPSTGRSTRPRSSGWSASCPTPPGAGHSRRARATAIAWWGRSRPRWRARSSRSCAASSPPGFRRSRSARCATAIALVRDAVRGGVASAAHDVSDGGLACALAEMAIAGGVGLRGGPRRPGRAPRRLRRDAACSGRGPAGSSSRPPIAMRRRWSTGRGGRRRGRRARLRSAASGSRSPRPNADVSVALADAERAWRSLDERI